MAYLREHTDVVASVNEGAETITTLVFGNSYFENDCDYRYDDSHKGFQEDVPGSIGGNPPGYHGYRGQICLMTAETPWYSNFSSGDMSMAPLSESEPGYCKSGLSGGAPRRGFTGSEAVTHCSAEKRFAIFVREIECDGATDCAALNRKGCFSSANTCGRCLPGFVGPGPQHEASRSAWDSNEPCTKDPYHMEDNGRRLLVDEEQGEKEVDLKRRLMEMLRAQQADMEMLRHENEELIATNRRLEAQLAYEKDA